MTFVRRQFLRLAAGVLALPAASRFASAQPASGAGTLINIAAIARDMYVFTFPLYEFYRVRSVILNSGLGLQPARINQFRHARQLSDHTARVVTAPNNDTLYSSAFLDLSRGPLIVEVPEIADRYYSLALMDCYTNNFAYIGTRTTGDVTGKYLIAGPGWNGSSPGGTSVISSPTNAVWFLGRILVINASDLPRVHQLQDALKLYPAPETEASLPFNGPPVTANDPWNYFAVALTENPPGQRDAAIITRMSTINVGPGQRFDPAKFNEADQKALFAGIEDAKRLISAKQLADKVVNGWRYIVPGIGNFGTDYLLRAAVALVGLGAAEPEEAMYMVRFMGDGGEPLDGSRSYRLHFASDNLPPVNAFWSISMYELLPDGRMFFTENPIKRYSIGDRTPGLTRNSDGALDIYLEREAPSGGRETNWLPTPAGRFSLVLRAYLPKQELVEHRYAPPPLTRLN
jgi:hypothetical protein